MMSSLSAYLCTLFSPRFQLLGCLRIVRLTLIHHLFVCHRLRGQDAVGNILNGQDAAVSRLNGQVASGLDWMGRTLLAVDWMGKTLLAVDWTGRTLQVWRSWISGHDSSNNMNWNWAKLASEDKFARGKRPNKPDTVSPVPIPQRKHTQQFTWPEENWSVYVSKSFC